jgi:hypothetical protein
VNRELADSREDSRESLEHSADMVYGVHVRRIEACDHWIKLTLFFWLCAGI